MTMQEEKPLPMRAFQVGIRLLWTPLSSTSELRMDNGASPDQTKRGVGDLKRAGFAASVEVGGVPLHWLTEPGLDHFMGPDAQASWHRPGAVGNLLLYDLPQVQAVHAIARWYATGEWMLSSIQFFERQPMIAAVEYRHPDDVDPSYLTICRASMMETEAELFDRLEAVPAAMQAHCVEDGKRFHPAGLAIVADGEWNAVRGLSMACAVLSRWVPPTHITAWCHGADGWRVSDGGSLSSGMPPREMPRLREGIGYLFLTASVRKLGKRTLTGILARLRKAGRAWRKQLALLTLVAICPVGAVAHYQDLAAEPRGGTETKKRMKTMKRLGLVRVVTEKGRAVRRRRWPKGVPLTLSERGQGGDRYAVTTIGSVIVCYAQGGRPADLAKRTKLGRLWTKLKDGSVVDRWPYQHEDIGYEFLGQVSQADSSFAPGWQARTALADGRRLDPDGVVLVCVPLWGRVWCYLEIELSDRSYSAIKPRGEKYGSPHRRDNRPVLVVCVDDVAEKNWHQVGQEFDPPIRMLTTTLNRLKQGKVFGVGVWSYYGNPVTLTTPGSEI